MAPAESRSVASTHVCRNARQTGRQTAFRGKAPTVMTDLKTLFSQLIRFETELWSAIDARLRAAAVWPRTGLEPMQVIARRESCRVNDIADELAITAGGTSKL